jgi:hypothetical protein
MEFVLWSIDWSTSGAGMISMAGSGSTLTFFDREDLAPVAAFLFALLVLEAFDTFEAIEVVETSMDSSRSGMSDCIDSCDWVDSLVEAFDVLDALDERDARPFFAFGRFEGAVVPAKWKKGHSGARR